MRNVCLSINQKMHTHVLSRKLFRQSRKKIYSSENAKITALSRSQRTACTAFLLCIPKV